MSGVVVDCQTGTPVADAEVSINQRGWGFDKHLVWDKDNVSRGRTDRAGHFTISYRIGGVAHIRVQKEGYLTAEQFEQPRGDVVVRMLQGSNPAEVTYNCRLSSECITETLEGNVRIYKNSCTQ